MNENTAREIRGIIFNVIDQVMMFNVHQSQVGVVADKMSLVSLLELVVDKCEDY